MTRLSIAWALVAAIALVGASGAWAQGKRGRVPIRVLVTHLSNHGSGIDKDAKTRALIALEKAGLNVEQGAKRTSIL